MKKYVITYNDGTRICAYTGNSQYPFYYAGEPYCFSNKRDARKIMQDVKRAYGFSGRQMHDRFRIKEF